VDIMPIVICVSIKGNVVYSNITALKKFGSISPEHIISKRIIDLYRPEQRKMFKEREEKILRGEGLEPIEQEYFFSNGSSIVTEARTMPIIYEGQQAFLSMAIDITERKQVELSLLEKEQELKLQAERLKESNTALKVLLEHREKEKVEAEENIFSTLSRLVNPYLDRLKNSHLNKDQLFLLQIIESNLRTISSPLAHKLSSPETRLTPTEIRVAGLIREGMTVKEAARLLNLSSETISFHRKKIRAKLGLTNKKVNLQSYLEFYKRNRDDGIIIKNPYGESYKTNEEFS
jgi:PAS domain S-box-containing protein